jgi:hypothetical protein
MTTYNPAALKEAEVPMPGTTMPGQVTKITEGQLGDFIKPEIIKAKWGEAKPEDNYIEIEATTDDGTMRKCLLSLPKENSVHPTSNLGKWNTAYRGYPKVGQRIYFTANTKGWWDFAY